MPPPYTAVTPLLLRCIRSLSCANWTCHTRLSPQVTPPQQPQQLHHSHNSYIKPYLLILRANQPKPHAPPSLIRT